MSEQTSREAFEKFAIKELGITARGESPGWRIWQAATEWQAARQAPASGEVEPVAWATKQANGRLITASIDRNAELEWSENYIGATVIPLYTHPPKAQGVPEGWSLNKVEDDMTTITITRESDGDWCGGGIKNDSGANGLRYEFLNALLTTPTTATTAQPASGEPEPVIYKGVCEHICVCGHRWWSSNPDEPCSSCNPQPAQQGSVPEEIHNHIAGLWGILWSPDWRSSQSRQEMSEITTSIEWLALSAKPQPEGDGWIRCNERFPTQADGDERCSLWVSGLYENTGNRFVMMAFVGEAIDLAKSGGIDYFMPTGLKRPQPPVDQEGE